jgi:hypothetical protein
MADLRRSGELFGVFRIVPGLHRSLYRISTAHNSSGRNRLFLNAFPPYPEIIEHSIWAKRGLAYIRRTRYCSLSVNIKVVQN